MTEIQEEWLKALESGRYQQGCGTLRSGGTYCCLGVFCELQSDVTFDALNMQYRQDRDLFTAYLTEDLYKRLGLRSKTGELVQPITFNSYPRRTLAEMNDNGMTFKDIAAYIRANPTNVFRSDDANT